MVVDNSFLYNNKTGFQPAFVQNQQPAQNNTAGYYYNYGYPPYFVQNQQYTQNSGGLTPYDVTSSLRANTMNSSQPVPYRQVATFKIPYNHNEAKLYQLANGQKVIIMPKKGPTTINTYVKVGSMNEADDKRGISHFIEHNLFNGSSKLQPGEFVRRVNEIGGRYNASTGFATTNYYIQSVIQKPEDFDNMLNIHSDMLLNPTFSQEMIEKERGPVESEIQMLEDDPSAEINSIILKNLFQINSSSMDLIGGSVKNIQNITRDDVVDYYNLYYTPDNMTTVLVGDVNPDEAVAKIAKVFNSYKQSNQALKHTEELKPIDHPVRVDRTSHMIDSSLVNMAFAGPKNNDIKGTYATHLLIEALVGNDDARLSKLLTPLNTEASVNMEVVSSDYNAPTSMMISANFDPDKTEEGLKAIYQGIYSMQTVPMSEQELNIVKNNFKYSLKNIAEDSMSITRLIGGNITNSNSMAFCDLDKIIDSITPQDIMNAARSYLDLNRVSIGVLHPENSSNSKQPQAASKTNPSVNFSGGVDFNFGENISSSVEEFNLPNNIKAFYNTNNETSLAAFDLNYRHDNFVNSNPAAPMVLSGMLAEGSALRPKSELYSIANLNNIKFDFGAAQRGITAIVNTEPEKVALAADLINEILMYPAFTEENLQKVKNQIKMNYASSLKSPYDKVLEELYSDDDPRSNNIRKVMDNIDALTLDDVKKFYAELMTGTKASATISAPSSVKNIALNKLSQMPAASALYSYKPIDPPKPLSNTKVLIEAEEKNQAHITQTFHINETGNVKDIAALNLMNLILGGSSSSRLFNDLRETQKLAYAVSSSYDSAPNDGLLSLDILSTTQDKTNGTSSYENLQKSLDGFKKHLDMLRTTPVSEQELENAKMTYLNRLSAGLETNAGKADALSGSVATYYGKDYLDKLIEAVHEIEPEDIQAIANKYLSQPSVISIIASQKTLDANKDYLASLGEVKEIQ